MMKMAGEDYEIEDRLTGDSLELAAKNFFSDLEDTEEESDTGSEDESEELEPSDSPSVEAGDSPEGNEGSADEDASSPLESALPEFFDFGEDGKLTQAEIRNLVAFQNFIRSNPDVADGIAKLVTGADPSAPVANPTASPIVTSPEGLDLEDPSVKALWEEHLALRTDLDRLRPMVESSTKALNVQQAEQAQSFIVRAQTAFAKEHDLTPEDVSRVQDVAARMNILPALMAPIDPVTGLPRKVDPLEALESSFKTAYAMMPEFETRRLAKIALRDQASKQKQKKLSSLAGSSGSVPKSNAQREPKNANERRNAMIAEVAASMFGTSTGE
jgi:hypothetical protein